MLDLLFGQGHTWIALEREEVQQTGNLLPSASTQNLQDKYKDRLIPLLYVIY